MNVKAIRKCMKMNNSKGRETSDKEKRTNMMQATWTK